MDFIRIWKEIDVDEIEKYLVIVDDIQGFCPSCKKAGIKYEDLAACPSCTREFRYATLREKGDAHTLSQLVAKLTKKVPSLSIVDGNDYNTAINRKKTKSLFNS
jgi:hypothetical protein